MADVKLQFALFVFWCEAWPNELYTDAYRFALDVKLQVMDGDFSMWMKICKQIGMLIEVSMLYFFPFC